MATIISVSLSLSPLNPVFADDDRSNLNTSEIKNFKNGLEKFKYELDAYKAAMKLRQKAREQINKDFKAAIKKATIDAKKALATANTAEQKLIIMNALKNARTAAVAIRDAALAALGPLPTPPAKPKN